MALDATYVLGSGQSVAYNNVNVGIRLDQPIVQVFSIDSLISLAVFALAALILRYIRVGRDIRAIGGDRHAARTTGAGRPALIGVFIVSTVGASLAGALLSYGLAWQTRPTSELMSDVLGDRCAARWGQPLRRARQCDRDCHKRLVAERS